MARRISSDTVQSWASADGGRGPPWFKIFIHVTNVVDRGLKVLFSVFFCYYLVFFRCSLPGRGLIVLFFGLFAIFGLFSVAPSPSHPPGNFSADALEYSHTGKKVNNRDTKNTIPGRKKAFFAERKLFKVILVAWSWKWKFYFEKKGTLCAINLFSWSKQKWLVWRAGFFPPIRGFWKLFRLLWLSG